MKVTIGVSNHHVHLTKEDYKILFGNVNIEKQKDLKQKGEYASTKKVEIATPKASIKNVRVLGPFRSYTQVEISKTDSYILGLNPPIRNSGDLTDSEEITIIGPEGKIMKKCCIIATRHVHINKDERRLYNLTNVDYVKIKIGNEKSSIIDNVFIKESENGVFELHIDTDDANACLIKNNDIGEIII